MRTPSTFCSLFLTTLYPSPGPLTTAPQPQRNRVVHSSLHGGHSSRMTQFHLLQPGVSVQRGHKALLSHSKNSHSAEPPPSPEMLALNPEAEAALLPRGSWDSLPQKPQQLQQVQLRLCLLVTGLRRMIPPKQHWRFQGPTYQRTSLVMVYCGGHWLGSLGWLLDTCS